MTIGWMKAFLKISQTPDCECPDCGAKKLRISFKAVSGEYGYTVIWCENCKHSATISRTKDENYFNRSEVIPDDLIFETA